MDESFEKPAVAKDTQIDKVFLNGWKHLNHPSYVKLVIESDDFSTEFGKQALSVFGFRKGPNRSPGGAETTDEILNAVVQAQFAYTLTFNVAAAKSKFKGNYVVELDAVDSEGIKTVLAITRGVATTHDMSEMGSLRYYHASSSGLIGQRLMIRLLQGDSGSWKDKPVYDNVKLVGNPSLDLLSMPIQKHIDDRAEMQVSSDGSILVLGHDHTKFARHVKNLYGDEPEPTASGD